VEASPLLLSFIIVAVGFIAGVVPFAMNWTHDTAHRWLAFGAGTILGAAFLHMIPEGYELAGAGSLWAVLLGFLVLFAVEQFSFKHPHREEQGEFYELGFLTFLGFTLHDLIDGIALGSGHEIPQLTPAIFLALVAHKIPTTFSLSLLMLHGGYRKRSILLFLGIALAAIPIGAALSQTLIHLLPGPAERTVGRLIFFSAGTFIYISAYELLPEMQRTSTPGARIGLFFIGGMAVMFLLLILHPIG
jgi:zinc and cadmium transporter